MTWPNHLERLLILALLAAPLALGLAGWREIGAAPAPPLTEPRAFDAWYAASFPLRDLAIAANNRLRLTLLGESAVADVVVGEDGWLFYRPGLKDRANASPLSESHLELLAQRLRQRRDWLASQGIDYIVAVAPNKSTLYDAYLPPLFQREFVSSRLQRLAARMARESVTFLDLSVPLRQAGSERRTYAKTDTHWNDWGAFVGSREIVEAVRRRYPEVPPLRAEDYRVVERTARGGDLTKMLRAGDHLPEPEIALEPLEPNRARKMAPRGYPDPAKVPFQAMVVMEMADNHLPRALVLRDSFGTGVVSFLSTRFQSIVYLWSLDFLATQICLERPHVVIHLLVERNIHALLSENPPQVRNPPAPADSPGTSACGPASADGTPSPRPADGRPAQAMPLLPQMDGPSPTGAQP